MSLFYNIVGATTVTTELVAPGTDINIGSVLITNVHASADATVTILISDTTNEYNIIHTLAIPADVSLFLDNPTMFKFGTEFGLYITVGSSDTVDVMISS
jgi:hypothetical protein